MTRRRSIARLFLLGPTLLVAACGNPFYGAQPTRSEIVTGGWVGLGTAPPPAIIYCYNTLARHSVDCRHEPESGQDDRLVSYNGGNYGSPPR